MIRVREIGDDEGFARLATVWDELLERADEANVFLSHAWLNAWWMAYRPPAALSIVLAEQDGRTVGIAPLMIVRETRLALPARVLRLVGDGTAETDHVGLLLDREQREPVAKALLDHIETMRWEIAEFNHMPEESWAARRVLEFAEARWRWAKESVVSPVASLPTSYEEFLGALPPRFRTALRSSRRRLQQRYRVDFGLHDDFGSLPEALEALFANHASRWRAKGMTGVFLDPRKRAFYADLAPRLLQRGWLHFYFLKLDGKIVAQEFCFACGETVMLLQEGFDFAFARENVGNVLRSMVFEHLIGNGIRAYDFLAGESRHKRTWANGSMNDLRLSCTRRDPYGALLWGLPLAVKALKERLRPLRDGGRQRRQVRSSAGEQHDSPED